VLVGVMVGKRQRSFLSLVVTSLLKLNGTVKTFGPDVLAKAGMLWILQDT